MARDAPLTLPALFATFLTSFTTSFDEFALTAAFGSEQTLPTYLYSQLRFPARLPIVVAMASVVIVGSFLTVVFTSGCDAEEGAADESRGFSSRRSRH